MNKEEMEENLELYELPTREIKITRFFEVARYLTKNDLWDNVEEVLKNSKIIGERIILDSLLGNAVKLVMLENSKKSPEKENTQTVSDTIKCGSRPPRRGGK